MKKIGFLSFGHWSDSPGSQVRTASDSLLQSIELAVAAEELGADGAYFRVHHFAQQLASPVPLLALRLMVEGDAPFIIRNRWLAPIYLAKFWRTGLPRLFAAFQR